MLNTRITPKQFEKLQVVAERKEKPISEYIREIILKELECEV
jgi:predicted DNA-binding protein